MNSGSGEGLGAVEGSTTGSFWAKTSEGCGFAEAFNKLTRDNIDKKTGRK
ncbi:MAG: hypothetical protein U1C56_02125 [Candidatus Curtissbacteria bacterium]|nr:hypothetical protein [Candidatus Curtissbacteria bacterium]